MYSGRKNVQYRLNILAMNVFIQTIELPLFVSFFMCSIAFTSNFLSVYATFPHCHIVVTCRRWRVGDTALNLLSNRVWNENLLTNQFNVDSHTRIYIYIFI